MGVASGLSDRQLPLWETLTDLVAGEATASVVATGDRRFSAINGTGVPAQFSVSIGSSQPAARVLGEAGRAGMTMPERLHAGGRQVCAVLTQLGQTAAVPALDSLLAQLLPPQAGFLDGWTGALWCGVALGADGRARARVYLNQRWGSVDERIARLGWAIAQVTGPAAAAAWMSAAHAVNDDVQPYGVALEIGQAQLVGLKVYAAARRSEFDAVAPYLTAVVADCALSDCARVVAACARLGGWSRPRMIMPCLEFRLAGGVRAKVDLALCALPSNDRAVDAMLTDMARVMQLPGKHYAATRAAVSPRPLSAERVERLQYVSVGCHRSRRELTVYFSPDLS